MKPKALLYEVVDTILWEHWDPIGVNDNPAARDEYSGYVSSVIQLLRNGADAYKISKHLHSLERASMGLSFQSNRGQEVAKRLLDAFHQNT